MFEMDVRGFQRPINMENNNNSNSLQCDSSD